jgi:hypothetical protein
MNNKKNNLELWQKVCTTDPKHTKKVSFGRKFTAVDAMYQIKIATEQFGPYGSKWGVKALVYDNVTKPNGDILEAIIEGVFYYPGGEFPLSVDMVYKVGNDTRKKLLTSLTSKALSKLGFNADIFMGRFDDNNYVNLAGAAIERKSLNEIKELLKPLSEVDEVMDIWEELSITQQQSKKIKALFGEKKQDILSTKQPA